MERGHYRTQAAAIRAALLSYMGRHLLAGQSIESYLAELAKKISEEKADKKGGKKKAQPTKNG